MAKELEELEIMKETEGLADDLWKEVMSWSAFSRDVVGKQLIRSVDSIGANVAEAYGRYHYGEKIQFLYFARGSLTEARYWIRRSRSRGLLTPETEVRFSHSLVSITRQLNGFINHLKGRKRLP